VDPWIIALSNGHSLSETRGLRPILAHLIDELKSITDALSKTCAAREITYLVLSRHRKELLKSFEQFKSEMRDIVVSSGIKSALEDIVKSVNRVNLIVVNSWERITMELVKQRSMKPRQLENCRKNAFIMGKIIMELEKFEATFHEQLDTLVRYRENMLQIIDQTDGIYVRTAEFREDEDNAQWNAMVTKLLQTALPAPLTIYSSRFVKTVLSIPSEEQIALLFKLVIKLFDAADDHLFLKSNM
jgi:hypothetical protein